MKKAELIFSVILVPVDYIMLVLAGSLAYTIRFSDFYGEHIREAAIELPFFDHLSIVIVVSLFWLVIFALSGLYSIGGTKKRLEEIAKIFMACSTGIMAIIIYIFFIRELFSSRFIVLAAWILSFVLVLFGRTVIRYIQNYLHKKGIGLHRLVLIGNGRMGEELISIINAKPKLGFKIVRQFSEFNDRVEASILALNKERKIDEVIQANPSLNKNENLRLLDFVSYNHFNFRYIADLLGTLSSNLEVQMLGGIPLIEMKRTKLDGWGRVYKRIFDIVGSIILIILTSPIMLAVAIAIKLDSKGPIIYRNERVGKKGQLFYLYKFRRMKTDSCTGQKYGGEEAMNVEKELIAEKSHREGALYKISNDPRNTRVGRFIEKTTLDELPQFFNVIIGNMSLVGPRPHQVREVEKYARHQKILLEIKPGVTGLAQISGRSDLDFNEEAKLDTFYVKNWSLIFDIIIVLKTPFILLKRHKAA